MTAPLSSRPDTAPNTVGTWRVPWAAAYLLFLVALPPQIGPTAYAVAVFTATGTYLAPHLTGRLRSLVFREYLIFTALLVIYLGLSAGSALNPGGRLFDTNVIPNQAAGLLLICICIPALTRVAADLFAERTRLVPLAALIFISLAAALTWRQDESIINDGQLYGVLAPALFIQFALFVGVIVATQNRLLRFLLLALPIPFLGAASNTVIQLSLIALVVTNGRPWVIWVLAVTLFAGLLAAIFGEGWLDPLVEEDINSLVRLHLWRNAFEDALAAPFGIGFGSGYSDFQAIRDPYIFHVYKGDQQSALTVANHSSVLDLSLRLGIFGLVAFGAMLVRCLNEAQASRHFMIAAGAITILLVAGTMNPILESARSALFVAFAIGYARGIAIGCQPTVKPMSVTVQEQDTPAQRRAKLAQTAPPRLSASPTHPT